MAAQSNAPYKDVPAVASIAMSPMTVNAQNMLKLNYEPEPFTYREPLESEILRVLEYQITQVEYCSEPYKSHVE